MNIWRFVLREIAHRKGNFSLGLLSVSVAVACLVGALMLIQGHRARTAEILAAKESELKERIAAKEREVAEAGRLLEDSMRKITKGLGFNILIVPADQDLHELHVEGTLSKTMPEEYVTRLANSKIVTINHLLPLVMRKIEWKEKGEPIVLIGTRGEVPQAHRAPSKQQTPLQDPVAPGQAILGFHVKTRHQLNPGDEFTLLGKNFVVREVYEERGTVDDSTIWINLAEAQELLGMQNLVNGMLALECNCASADRLGEIRSEIAGILPGTQVIERGPPALARAEARNTAKKEAEQALAREKAAAAATLQAEAEGRNRLQRQLESFAGILVPLVVAACGLWVGVLSYSNVRQRAAEIGILRAIGFRSSHILLIFLGKALVIGASGAAAGYVAGVLLAALLGDGPASLMVPRLMLLSAVVALLLAAVASWIPAMLAARQDPALVLQED